MIEWFAVLVFITICVANAALLGNISRLVGPHKPSAAKLSPYESGMPPIGPAHQRYTVRYYLIAMLFVVFDIEAVFLYPWAIAFNAIGCVRPDRNDPVYRVAGRRLCLRLEERSIGLGLLENRFKPGVVTTTADFLFNWAHR